MDGVIQSKAIDLKTCTPEIVVPPRMDVLNQVPGTSVLSDLDETQDLMIIVNILSDFIRTHDFKYQINLRAISTGKEHPLAHGPYLVSGRGADLDLLTKNVGITVLGALLSLVLWSSTKTGRCMCGIGIKMVNLMYVSRFVYHSKI